VGGRKLGGILCEGSWGGGAATIVAGIGINVRPLSPELPEEIRSRSTSLETLHGGPVDRSSLADCLVAAVLRRITQPLDLTAAEVAELHARDVLRGRTVRVTEPVGGALLAEGTQLGVDPAGALLLRDPAGTLRRIHSGTVRAV
jgi:biotin-(acetyl-CoA carboxylase) ligase